ncbi:hypothetical protein IAU60_002855 [Kwoniella sp. DSM 27419]
MAAQLSSDEINKICADLVYQVAYAFYDTPYIIILKLMVLENVTTEAELATKIGLSTPEVRKYMGTLHLHRLVKRHVNKEKVPIPDWRLKQLAAQPQLAQAQRSGPGGRPGAVDKDGRPVMQDKERTKDVYYWYLDYREFANVVKYRLAMMRKGIDEKIKQEVGHRGYICPLDGRMYDPLDLSHVFDPFTNTFKCEDCSSELIEHDPTISSSGVNTTAQDAMQRFNIATAPIRDALKGVEAVPVVPSTNIVAWIAQNVKTTVAKVDGEANEEDEKKFEVVIGQEDDEQEKEKLAQQQREQNALPHWYTHSTVTGQATTLGLADKRRRDQLAERNRTVNGGDQEGEDDVLAAHYEILGEDEGEMEMDDVGGRNGYASEVSPASQVKLELGSASLSADVVDAADDDDEEEGTEGVADEPGSVPVQASAGSTARGVTVTVNGVPKRLEDVTDEDHEFMTTEEYEAYAQAMYG